MGIDPLAINYTLGTPGAPSTIDLPLGNYSIDELIDFINVRILYDF
jgi:hypothetical protein